MGTRRRCSSYGAHQAGRRIALKLATDAAYKLIGLFSNIELTAKAGHFKLLSRRVVNELLQLKEATPYLRGSVNWVGFNQLIYLTRGKVEWREKQNFRLFENILHDMVSLRGPAGTLIGESPHSRYY